MSQERADKYRRKAEEYRVKAVKAPRDDDKAAWLNHLGLAAGVCEKARVSKIQLSTTKKSCHHALNIRPKTTCRRLKTSSTYAMLIL